MSNKDNHNLAILCEKFDSFYSEFQEEKKVNKSHREEIEPILELIRGANTARKIVLWVTSLVLAVGAVTLMFKGIFK